MKRINKDFKFPHPVYGLDYNIIEEIEIEGEVVEETAEPTVYGGDNEPSIIDGSYRLQYVVQLNDPYIEGLIETGEAVFCCEIDCRKTFFRKCVKQNSPDFEILINSDYLTDEFSSTITVVANKSLKYANPRADKDFYPGAKKHDDLNAGDIICYAFYKKYDLDKANNVGSFVTVIRDDKCDELVYNLRGSDIEIHMPVEMHDIFSRYIYGDKRIRKSNSAYLMSSVINEALLCAVVDMNSYWSHGWAEAIRKWIDTRHPDMKIEWESIRDGQIDSYTAVKIVRAILDNPHKKMFELIKNK